jgi:ribosomal protein L21
MYAVIKTGGKQYRVAAGQKLKIEQIPADIGQEITLDQVLSVGEGEQIQIGSPSRCAVASIIRSAKAIVKITPKSASTPSRPDHD